MVKRIAWLAGMVGALGAGGYHLSRHLTVRAAPPATDLLRRAMRADLEAVGYSGETETISFVREGQMSARAHILHQAPGKYKVSYLTGPQAGTTVGSDGIVAWRCGSKGQVMEVTNETITPDEVAQRFRLLLRNYQLRVTRKDRVARRISWIIDVQPVNPGNAWKRFWVDKQHAVILRTESYDSTGMLRSRSAFTNIEFGVEISDLVFVLPSDAPTYSVQQRESARAAPLLKLRKELGFKPLLPEHVPPGYAVEGYYSFDHRCCEGKSAIVRYIDGLNSISLFEAVPVSPGESPPDRRPIEPADLHGGLGWVADQFGSSNVVSMLDSDPQVVLVGDLSKAELLRMAKSLR